jgi:hypothetical protein
MSVWIDEKPKYPFEGALIVMNMGQEDLEKFPPPAEYLASLVSEISEAHAAGRAVIYLFDKGTSPIPEHLDWMDDMDFRRLSSSLGMPSLSFSLSVKERQRELEALATGARGQDDFVVRGPVRIMGACLLDGERVLMPPVEVGS